MGIENGSPAAFKHVHRVCVFIHDRVWTSFDRVKYLMVLSGNLLHHHLLHVGRCQPPGRIAAHREKVIGCNLPSLRHSRTPMRRGGRGSRPTPLTLHATCSITSPLAGATKTASSQLQVGSSTGPRTSPGQSCTHQNNMLIPIHFIFQHSKRSQQIHYEYIVWKKRHSDSSFFIYAVDIYRANIKPLWYRPFIKTKP